MSPPRRVLQRSRHLGLIHRRLLFGATTMEISPGALSTAAALRSYLQGEQSSHAFTSEPALLSASQWVSSSEGSLRVTLTKVSQVVPLRRNQRGFPSWVSSNEAPLRRNHCGRFPTGELLPAWLLGATPRGAIIEHSPWCLVHRSASPGSGSSEPTPRVLLHRVFPLAAPPRRN